MTVRGIIVLEGADSAGKSTLARRLVERHDARYVHSTVRRDVWRYHVGAVRLAVRYARDRLVVLDRHFLSELVYGAVFRGGPAYDVAARCLDRVLRRHGAITVLCVPADQLAQEARWAVNRAAGKREHFDRVREVIQLYADLARGNVAHPGAGYLSQLIRFQDYAERDDVLIYDLDAYNGPRGIAAFEKILRDRLAFVQRQVVPDRGANLAGRADPRLGSWLLVGEAPSPRSATYATPAWPWCDRDDRTSAATWFNRAVHHLALREDRFELTNAIGDFSYLPELLWGRPRQRVIALGNVAHERVRALGGEAIVVEHPQHHRRFHHGDGPVGYAEILRGALG